MTKYLFTVLNGLALVVLAAIGVLLPRIEGTGPTPAETAVDRPQVDRLPGNAAEQLSQARDAIGRVEKAMSSAPDAGDASLAIAEEPPPEVLRPKRGLLANTQTEDKAKEKDPPPPLPERELRVVLEGSEARALIDGVLVSEGDRLPGDGRVLRIQSDAVLVAERGGRRQRLIPPDG